MPRTRTFAVNDVGDPEPVMVQTYCNRVTVAEDPGASGWPRDFNVRAPDKTSPAFRKPGGTSQLFQSVSEHVKFTPGQIIGYVETVSGAGATTFVQYED